MGWQTMHGDRPAQGIQVTETDADKGCSQKQLPAAVGPADHKQSDSETDKGRKDDFLPLPVKQTAYGRPGNDDQNRIHKEEKTAGLHKADFSHIGHHEAGQAGISQEHHHADERDGQRTFLKEAGKTMTKVLQFLLCHRQVRYIRCTDTDTAQNT